MSYQEYIDLSEYSSMRLGGKARYFARLTNPVEIKSYQSLASKLSVPTTVIGSGTNTFFADGVINRFFMKNEIYGKEMKKEMNSDVIVQIGAGEDWDKVVSWSIDKGLSGIEMLSGIPGTTGAAPVQNIGAYGGQLSDVLHQVIVWDVREKCIRTFAATDCQFGYRSSLFKQQKGNWVVLAVSLRLSKEAPGIPQYSSLKEQLQQENISIPNLTQIRNAVLAVRLKRLPDIKKRPNLGSYFVNPIVSKVKAEAIKDVVYYKFYDGKAKIPAGWLIEQAGLKGKQFGNFCTSSDNALILIHNDNGTTKELLEVEIKITNKVKKMFDITLEREPNYVS
jgi:UDP-N-acetylmuramate dehydrogenase